MKVGIATGDFVTEAVRLDGSQILGGAGHIRLGQYLRYTNHNYVLGELAWDPAVQEFAIRKFDSEDLTYGLDMIVMQRWMHASIPEQIKTVRKKGVVIVNDIDDWYWGLGPGNLAYYASHPRAHPNENTDHYRKTLAVSDAVITSTPYLAKRLSQFVASDKIHIMENHVELDKFTPHVHEEEDRPTVGWIGSTAHRTSGDLDILKSLYRTIGTEGWRYHHSGHVGYHPHFYDVVGLGKDDVTILLPVPPERLDDLMRFDIGVVPIRKSPFNESKSWIKGIEYAAAGIPFVASDSGEYKRLKKEYKIGRTAKNNAQWVKHFKELRDPAVRQEEADRQRVALEPLDAKWGAAKWDGLIASLA